MQLPAAHDAVPTEARQHYLDVTRAALMFLGIPYHTACAYSAFDSWTVNAGVTSLAVSWAAEAIHSFRMPAFFVISGYFSGLIIAKRGPHAWCRQRATRLLVPLLTVAVLVNPFVMLARAVGRSPPDAAISDWRGQLGSIGSQWVAQLWFLGDLFVYSLMLYGLVLVGRRMRWPVPKIWGIMTTHPLQMSLLGLVALGLYGALSASVISALGLGRIAHGLLLPSRTFANLPMFFVGVGLFFSPAWMAHFSRFRPALVPVALLLGVAFAFLDPRSDAPSKLAFHFVTPIAGIILTQVIVASAKRWFDASSALVRFSVRASMVVYLIHMIFVVWLVILLRSVSLAPELEVALIIAAATIGSLAFFEVCQWNRLLFFLFHGYPRRPQPGRALAAGASLS